MFIIKGNKSATSLSYDLNNIWEIDTTGLESTPEDCPIDSYKLCDDESCTTPSTDSWFTLASSQLTLDASKGIPPVKKYLGVFSTGKAFTSK